MHRQAAAVAVASGCAGALLAAAATPQAVLAEAGSALTTSSAADPTAAVVPVAAVLAWGLALWLVAVAVLTLAGHLPGVVGRCAAWAARRVAPGAVRRAVELALGLSLAAGATCAGPAAAATPTTGSVVAAALTTGTLPTAHTATGASGAAASAPSLDWPTGQQPPADPVAAPAARAVPTPAASPVVVAAGDTLWGLAERSLGPGATRAQVAEAWPAWWTANRDVIGADPDLIRPGDRLTPPPPAR